MTLLQLMLDGALAAAELLALTLASPAAARVPAVEGVATRAVAFVPCADRAGCRSATPRIARPHRGCARARSGQAADQRWRTAGNPGTAASAGNALRYSRRRELGSDPNFENWGLTPI